MTERHLQLEALATDEAMGVTFDLEFEGDVSLVLRLYGDPDTWVRGGVDGPHEMPPQLRKYKKCRLCGHRFDHDLLGKHGCPNCEGHP